MRPKPTRLSSTPAVQILAQALAAEKNVSTKSAKICELKDVDTDAIFQPRHLVPPQASNVEDSLRGSCDSTVNPRLFASPRVDEVTQACSIWAEMASGTAQRKGAEYRTKLEERKRRQAQLDQIKALEAEQARFKAQHQFHAGRVAQPLRPNPAKIDRAPVAIADAHFRYLQRPSLASPWQKNVGVGRRVSAPAKPLVQVPPRRGRRPSFLEFVAGPALMQQRGVMAGEELVSEGTKCQVTEMKERACEESPKLKKKRSKRPPLLGSRSEGSGWIVKSSSHSSSVDLGEIDAERPSSKERAETSNDDRQVHFPAEVNKREASEESEEGEGSLMIKRLLSRSAGLKDLMECHMGLPEDLPKPQDDMFLMSRGISDDSSPRYLTTPTHASPSQASPLHASHLKESSVWFVKEERRGRRGRREGSLPAKSPVMESEYTSETSGDSERYERNASAKKERRAASRSAQKSMERAMSKAAKKAMSRSAGFTGAEHSVAPDPQTPNWPAQNQAHGAMGPSNPISNNSISISAAPAPATQTFGVAPTATAHPQAVHRHNSEPQHTFRAATDFSGGHSHSNVHSNQLPNTLHPGVLQQGPRGSPLNSSPCCSASNISRCNPMHQYLPCCAQNGPAQNGQSQQCQAQSFHSHHSGPQYFSQHNSAPLHQSAPLQMQNFSAPHLGHQTGMIMFQNPQNPQHFSAQPYANCSVQQMSPQNCSPLNCSTQHFSQSFAPQCAPISQCFSAPVPSSCCRMPVEFVAVISGVARPQGCCGEASSCYSGNHSMHIPRPQHFSPFAHGTAIPTACHIPAAYGCNFWVQM